MTGCFSCCHRWRTVISFRGANQKARFITSRSVISWTRPTPFYEAGQKNWVLLLFLLKHLFLDCLYYIDWWSCTCLVGHSYAWKEPFDRRIKTLFLICKAVPDSQSQPFRTKRRRFFSLTAYEMTVTRRNKLEYPHLWLYQKGEFWHWNCFAKSIMIVGIISLACHTQSARQSLKLQKVVQLKSTTVSY